MTAPKDSISEIVDAISPLVIKAIEETSSRLIRRILRHSGAILKARNSVYRGFEERLSERWREPLSLYELSLYLTHKLGADFNKTFQPVASKKRDLKFEPLIRLHANAALIGGEILQLLRSGYASGAHARWRSLHETAVIALFIAQEQSETAERFVLHKFVKSYQDACDYQKYHERLGHEPLTAEEFARVKKGYDAVTQKYGSDFAGSYGWAKSALAARNPHRKGGVTFGEIEKAIALGFWTPYFRLASHAIHPTATTIFYNIASIPGTESPMFAGPSNNGLADPGHGALLSMNIVSATLMAYAAELNTFPEQDLTPRQLIEHMQPSMRMQVTCKVLEHLAETAGEAFLRVQKQLEDEELSKHSGAGKSK